MNSFYRRVGKHLFDRVTGLLGLVLLSPLIALVALLVRWNFGAPVLFRQQRAGRNGATFTVIKFRSMTERHDEIGNLLPDEARLTKFGRWIRHLRLDELLQLWNVVRGEMSCIGPRPALTEYVANYDRYQRRRLEIRPGMTGWSQVNGNAVLTWNERILLDIWYVDHLTFWLDLRIMLATFGVVLCGEHRNQLALKKAKQHAEQGLREI